LHSPLQFFCSPLYPSPLLARIGLQLSAKTGRYLALLVCLLVGLLPPATAEVALAPRLVIIDTGIDSAMPLFTNH